MPNHELSIFIATPTANGSVAINYMTSVLALVSTFQSRRVSHQFMHFDAANVVKSRNYLANYFLQRTEATHLLFIDADMRFRVETIMEMLEFDKEFVACAYPKRQIDLLALIRNAIDAGRRNPAVDYATILAQNFQYPLTIFDQDRPPPSQGARVEMTAGFIEVSKVGAGIVLLKRSVLQTLTARSAVERYDSLGDPSLDLEDVYGFFDLVNPGGGRPLLSEDLSFCYRWTNKCQGRIWCKVDHEIGHVGPFLFSVIPGAGILRHGEAAP
jgi:hypothetical protein